MSHFWAGVFENLRGRGRNATLFAFVVPALVVSAFVAAQVPEATYRDTIKPALPLLGLLGASLTGRALMQARKRSRERLGRSALSADERCKARAKLVGPRLQSAPKNIFVPPG